MAYRNTMILSLTLAALAAVGAPALADAADPVSPTDSQTFTDTHTPTFVVQLDSSTQADGLPTDYADVAISVSGSDGRGGVTVVAFCNASDLGGGRVGCADPGHPLANGVYAWEFMYRTHTCFQLPAIGSYQAPPTCTFAFFPHNAGAIFRVNVPAAPPPSPPPTTPAPPPAGGGSLDTVRPRLAVFAAFGAVGRTLKLRFQVHDNSGEAEIALGI